MVATFTWSSPSLTISYIWIVWVITLDMYKVWWSWAHDYSSTTCSWRICWGSLPFEHPFRESINIPKSQQDKHDFRVNDRFREHTTHQTISQNSKGFQKKENSKSKLSKQPKTVSSSLHNSLHTPYHSKQHFHLHHTNWSVTSWRLLLDSVSHHIDNISFSTRPV